MVFSPVTLLIISEFYLPFVSTLHVVMHIVMYSRQDKTTKVDGRWQGLYVHIFTSIKLNQI